MSYGTHVIQKHEMKLVRRKYQLTIAVKPECENVNHLKSVLNQIPGFARMESMEQQEDGSVVIVFVEEAKQHQEGGDAQR